MSDPRRRANRSMFWRVLRRSVFANRGRLLVILLALGAGSAVTAALLNLQVDAKRRITTEFRSFGANVLITPRNSATLREPVLDAVPNQQDGKRPPRAALLYVTADVMAYSSDGADGNKLGSSSAIFTGFRYDAGDLQQLMPHRVIAGNNFAVLDATTCDVGEALGSQFHLQPGAFLKFQVDGEHGGCVVSEIRSFGAAEDNQIFLELGDVQKLAKMPGQISLVEMNVSADATEIEEYLDRVRERLPEAEVRPIRQFTESEARLYGKISGILTATVVVVLLLTALCVMAAMTNIAAERKNDVGLMKAIGGSVRRVLRIFLAEAALLGLAGGLSGAALGILISMALGKAVFGVAAQPRLVVYPVSVGLTVLVAVLAAYPLRRLTLIRPAAVFRGEE